MSYQLLIGDARAKCRELPAASVQTCITSPPFWGLRDYETEPQYWPAMQYVPMAGLPPVEVPEWTGELGSEPTPHLFIAHLVAVFAEVWRVLKKDGTCWVNLGDSYANRPGGNGPQMGKQFANHIYGKTAAAKSLRLIPEGLKHKDLMMMPARLALALQAAGWYLRQDIIWHKPNPMPESVKDRCTKAHEYIFLLSKKSKYYFNAAAIQETVTGNSHRRASKAALAGQEPRKVPPKAQADAFGVKNCTSFALGTGDLVDDRNKRSVWKVATAPYPGAHFATFPPELIRPCILAGSQPGDVVLDIFGGTGTTGQEALAHGRSAVVIEVSEAYARLIQRRLARVQTSFLTTLQEGGVAA